MDTDNYKKFFIYQFVVITAGTVAGLYLYNNILKMQRLRQDESYYGQMNLARRHEYMSPEIEHIEKTSFPKLELEIITSEYDDSNDIWIPTLKHTFYGNTEDEIMGLVNAHRQTDAFFDASFSGIFKWKGGTIELKNTIYDVKYK